MQPIISVQNLSKRYKLGVFNAKTLREEAEAFLARFGRRKAELAVGSSQSSGNSSLATRHSSHAEPSSDFWALRDVSFDVQPGEVIGVIGRNGAGKSTLLKILSRITEPTSGEARIRGRVASLLEVGTGFHPELTGRENVFLNGAILGMTKQEIRNKFDEIVAFAEIEKFIDTPVKRYSSGMYVRLAFAVAAHLEPEILIVDEVLAVGDMQFQHKCLGKMKDVSGKDGRTVLFVSHNMNAVRNLCGRVVLLEAGRISTIASPDETTGLYESSQVSSAGRHVYESTHQYSDQAARIDRATVSSQSKTEGPFEFGDQLAIAIKYSVFKTLSAAHVTLEVCSSANTIFVSFDTDCNPELLEARDPGSYEAIIHLPVKLLKPGRYTANIGIGIPQGDAIARVDQALAFEIVLLDSAYSAIASYASHRAGVVAVSVPWNTSKA